VFATIDPILYARVVHVGEGEVEQEELADFARATDASRAIGAWRASMSSERAALFREAYRYWLGLRLPFLYGQAALSLAREQDEFRALAAGVTPMEEWRVDGSGVESLDVVHPDHLLTPRMLVETAVELTSRRVDGRRPNDSAGGSGAARVLSCATALIGEAELALQALVPMALASLHTTDPVQAFGVLCGRVKKAPDECRSANSDQWWAMLTGWLDRMILSAEGTRVLKSMRMSDVLWSRNEHPLLTAPARAWESRAEEGSSYRSFLLNPNAAPHGVAETIWRDFQPAVTVYSFHQSGATRRTMTVVDNDALALSGESISRDAVHELLTMHGIMRRVAGFEPPEPRLCAHVVCAHHQAGYCALYPFVPRAPERCTFPVRLARMRVEARGSESARGHVLLGRVASHAG
jgi:hypothetical protein